MLLLAAFSDEKIKFFSVPLLEGRDCALKNISFKTLFLKELCFGYLEVELM